MVWKAGVVMASFHASVSLTKSILRIIGCLFLFAVTYEQRLEVFAAFMTIAECLGIAEEWDNL